MGLLDDAIREHLELKRAHGADPTEVERQEREALGAPRQAEFAPSEAPPTDEVAAVAASEVAPAEPAEPVEEEPEEEAEEQPDEVPPGDALEHPTQIAEPAEPGPDPDLDPEDVLEETPDFLQETPEHERLWFEQRPPRDFDWDK
jgi:hypothetical protein